MNRIITAMLLLLTGHLVPAQTLPDKLYAFTDPSGKPDVALINDSIITRGRLCSRPLIVEPLKLKISKVVYRGNKIYYLTHFGCRYQVAIFSAIHPDSTFTFYILSRDESHFEDTFAAMTFIRNDTVVRPGITLYGERGFQRLKLLPSAKKMTRSDFKNFITDVCKNKIEMNAYVERKKLLFFPLPDSYINNILRVTLANSGYSPLMPGKKLTALLNHYKKDPELSPLIEAALNTINIAMYNKTIEQK